MSFSSIKRSDKNPLLSPIGGDNKHIWENLGTFNPAATVYDNKIYVIYRAAGGPNISSFGLAILSDPETIEYRSELPILESDGENMYERLGVEDPRLTKIDDTYYIVYTAPSLFPAAEYEMAGKPDNIFPYRIRCSMISTRDFATFNRHGVILPDVETKDGTLFPEKINGKYALLHRIMPDIYISYSDSLEQFPKGEFICGPRKDSWDNSHVGGGTPPIKTPYGWLIFYHGVHRPELNTGLIYSGGMLILDIKDPNQVLYRSDEPILSPNREFEEHGFVDNVVFPSGIVEWNESFYIYYGAADKYVGVASVEKSTLYDYFNSKGLKKTAAHGERYKKTTTSDESPEDKVLQSLQKYI